MHNPARTRGRAGRARRSRRRCSSGPGSPRQAPCRCASRGCVRSGVRHIAQRDRWDPARTRPAIETRTHRPVPAAAREPARPRLVRTPTPQLQLACGYRSAQVSYHALIMVRLAFVLVTCICVVACDKKDPEDREPGTPSGEVRVSPGDRLGWTQQAADAVQQAAFQYALYVDGSRMTLVNATCTAAASGAFDCSAPVPTLSAG